MSEVVRPHQSAGFPWKRTAVLAFLIVQWYLFSYLFNANMKGFFSSQANMSHAILPLLFSIFLGNTAATGLWVAHAAGWQSGDVLNGRCLAQLVFGHKADFSLLCASNVVGVIATCLVLQHGSIQLVQIARSLGPLFTAAWAYLLLDQLTTSFRFSCLGITLAGTMLASWQEPSLCITTGSMMFIINTTLTFRNAATKKLLHSFPTSNSHHLAGLLLCITSGVGLMLVIILWGVAFLLGAAGGVPGMEAARQLFVLGACNFVYNLCSQLVLANVAVVSHGMLELFKRVFVLLAASMLLQGTGWQLHNVAGAVVATVGTLLYFRTTSPWHQHQHTPQVDQHQHVAPSKFHDLNGNTHGVKISDHVPYQRVGPSPGSRGAAKAADDESCPAAEARRRWKTRVARIAVLAVLLFSPFSLFPTAIRAMAPKVSNSTSTSTSTSRVTTSRDTDQAGNTKGAGLLRAVFSVQQGPTSSQVPQWSPFLEESALRRASYARSACSLAVDRLQPTSNVITKPSARATLARRKDLAAAGPQQAGAMKAGTVQVSQQTLGSASGAAGALQSEAVRSIDNEQHAYVQQQQQQQQQPPLVAPGLPPRATDSFTGVYTGWIGRDNLGDEIVWDIFLDLLTAAVLESTSQGTTVTVDRNSSALLGQQPGCDQLSCDKCDFSVLGGGSTVYVDYVKRIVDALPGGRPVMLFGSGHQSGLQQKRINHKYISMLMDTAWVGGVRGNHTAGYLRDVGKRAVPILRDSGLLAGRMYRGGRTSVAQQLVPGKLLLTATLGKSRALMPVYVQALTQLIVRHGFQVVLQPVDEGNLMQHRALLEKINALLPANASKVIQHEEYHDWAAVVDLYKRSNVSLNSRLHSGVLAASALTPIVYWASNVKYHDLMGSIGMEAWVVDNIKNEEGGLDMTQMTEDLVQWVLAALHERDKQQQQLGDVQNDTLMRYRAAMVGLLSQLQLQSPAKYRAVMCCKHVHISRTPAKEYRSFFRVECLKPEEPTS